VGSIEKSFRRLDPDAHTATPTRMLPSEAPASPIVGASQRVLRQQGARLHPKFYSAPKIPTRKKHWAFNYLNEQMSSLPGAEPSFGFPGDLSGPDEKTITEKKRSP
jgi:hypothetical protein